jgi:hypothetical protein
MKWANRWYKKLVASGYDFFLLCAWYSVVCTNHITEAERKWERDRITIILQWMNGYGIPHPLSAHQKLRVGLAQHTALA